MVQERSHVEGKLWRAVEVGVQYAPGHLWVECEGESVAHQVEGEKFGLQERLRGQYT